MTKKMDLVETIRIPLLGIASTAASLYVSLESVTAIAQCVAAILACGVAVLTIVLTVLKIIKINKNDS